MEKSKIENEKCHEKLNVEEIKKFGWGIRHLQVTCMCVCVTALIMVRSSMGVAILAMTDVNQQNGTITIYEWDKSTQAVILSSFFWGYVAMQIPAGILSKKFGGKPLLLFAVLANAVICLSLPLLASLGGWQLVCAARVAIGLTQACTYPGSHTLIGQWLPDHERVMLSSIVYGGTQLGTILGMPIAGLLAETSIGWPLIFYAMAGLMLATAVMWYYCTASSPAQHRFIGLEELEFIEKCLNKPQGEKRIQTPWKFILTSRPVWAVVVAHIGVAYAFIMLFVDLPTYMEKGLGISLKNSAALSSLPYIGMWIGSVASGMISEKLFNKGILSAAACRKVFNSIGVVGISANFIVLGFLGPDDSSLAVVVLVIGNTLCGFTTAGFFMNHLELSPNFAGLLMSLTNFMANACSVMTPIMTSTILQNDPTNISGWRIVFFVAAGVNLTTNLIYVILGTSDRQSWDDPNFVDKQNSDPEEMKPVINIEKEKEANAVL